MNFTVNHPRIAGVSREGLSAKDRDAHVKAGWVSADRPAPPAAEVEVEPVADEAPKPRRRKK